MTYTPAAYGNDRLIPVDVQASIRKNAAGTAWFVIRGRAPGTVGAANILTACNTRAQAIAWCGANDLEFEAAR